MMTPQEIISLCETEFKPIGEYLESERESIAKKADLKNFLINNSSYSKAKQELDSSSQEVFAETEKEQIELPSGSLISDFAEKVAGVVKNKNRIFYKPDVREVIEISQIEDSENKIRYTGFSIIKPQRFITLAEKYILPVVMIKTKAGLYPMPKSMGAELAGITLSSPQFQDRLPRIDRIFTTPIPILFNGELTLPKKGYDERFNSWLPYESPAIEIKEMNLEEAKQIIENIFKEFCFKERQDFINAIAGLLTPFLRGLYKTFYSRTPLFFYLANRERAGKDYCAGVSSILYLGYATEESPISSGESGKYANNTDELRKKITSALISGKKKLHFANNKGYLDNAILEAVLTNEQWNDRMLGKNESICIDNELEFSGSGNIGIGFTPDLANRMRIIRLFLDIENANERQFENPNLHEYIRKNRGLILSALYALVKNWFSKGMPESKIPFSSYPEWARVCGGIMESAGYESPCVADKETLGLGGDTETQDMKTLFELCYEKHPNEWIRKEDIKRIVFDDQTLFGYLDFNQKSDQVKFGNKIIKYVGRILSDIQLKVKDLKTRASRQEFMFSKQKSGNLGNLGNLFPSPEGKKILFDNRVCNTLPTLPRLPKIDTLDTFQEPVKKELEPVGNICFYCGKESQNIKLLENSNPACEDCNLIYEGASK